MGKELILVRKTEWIYVPARLIGNENQARWAAMGTGLAGGTRIYYPGLLILITNQFVTVTVNNKPGMWVTCPHAVVTWH